MSDEVKNLRREASDLKEAWPRRCWRTGHSKKAYTGMGATEDEASRIREA